MNGEIFFSYQLPNKKHNKCIYCMKQLYCIAFIHVCQALLTDNSILTSAAQFKGFTTRMQTLFGWCNVIYSCTAVWQVQPARGHLPVVSRKWMVADA
jgi:hypothetical protein